MHCRKENQSGRKCKRERQEKKSQRNVEDETDILDLRAGQIFENRNQVKKLVIVGIGEPAADGDGVLRMEDIRGGRVVDDDRLSNVAADLRQILDIVALVVVAAVPE